MTSLNDNTSERGNAPPAHLLGVLTDIETKHAPSQIYWAGDASLIRSGRKVSVVGSRAASAEGMRRARVLAQQLVEHGIVVVSGLAEGIDVTAHQAAIEAGGRTIAVIGTPLNQAYPKKHTALQDAIARGHLVVSQLAPGTKVQPFHFPQRNRLMALLTDATVIVEAGESSGTLHQGWESIRLGRPLFIMESVVRDTTLNWPQEMIGYGAQVLSRESLPFVLENLPSVAHADAAAFAD